MAVRSSAIDVVVRMRGGPKFAAQTRKTAAELEAMGVKGTKAMTSMALAGSKLQAFGSKMTRTVSLPVAALGGYAIKSSLDFNKAMELISTQAGASQNEVDKLSGSVLAMSASGKFEQGPTDLANALFHVESAGFRGAQAVTTLRSAAKLAATGQADLEDTTNALVGAQKTGIGGAQNLSRAIGTLNAAVGAGNLRMDDMVAALGTGFLSAAHQVGLKLKDVGSALAELTKQGIPASAAATRLRMTFTLMAAPTDKAKAALKAIGLGASEMARTMRSQGLIPALQLLKDHLSDLSKVQQTQTLTAAFGGARSGTTIMALVNNLKDLGSVEEHVTQTTSDFGTKLHETRDTAAFQMQAALAQMQAALIRLGDTLGPVVLPAISKMANTLSDLVGWFDKLPAPIKDTAAQATLLLVAAGPLTWLFGSIMKNALLLGKAFAVLRTVTLVIGTAFASLLPEQGALTAGFLALDASVVLLPALVLALAAGFFIAYHKIKAFHDAVDSVANFIRKHWYAFALVPIIGGFVVFDRIVHSWGDIKQAARDTLGWLKEAAGKVAHPFVVAFQSIRDAIKSVLKKIQELIDKVTGPLKGALDWIDSNTILGGGGAHVTGNAAAIPPDVRRIFRQFGQPLPKRAMGGPVLPGGTALVGERGPELAQFPFGAQIFSSNETKKLLASDKSAPTIVIPISLNGRVIAEETVRAGETAKARQ